MGPTTETLLRRAEIVGLHNALDPDAATYIGQLLKIGAISETEKQAGEIWAGFIQRYRTLMEGPKAPGAVALDENRGGPMPDDPAYFAYVKSSHNFCEMAVRREGILIYSAARGAVCGEPQRTPHRVKIGLAALWRALQSRN